MKRPSKPGLGALVSARNVTGSAISAILQAHGDRADRALAAQDAVDRELWP